MTKNKQRSHRIVLSALFLFLILLVNTLLSTSCKKKETPFLSYQDKSYSLTAKIDINDNKYSLEMARNAEGNFLLTFTEPDTLNGVSIERNGEGLFLAVDDVKIPMKSNTNITTKLFSLLELKKDNMTSTKADILNGVKVNVLTFEEDIGKVTLVLSADKNIPLRISSDINGTQVVMNVSDFCIQEKQ